MVLGVGPWQGLFMDSWGGAYVLSLVLNSAKIWTFCTRPPMYYIVAKFPTSTNNTSRDMIIFLVISDANWHAEQDFFKSVLSIFLGCGIMYSILWPGFRPIILFEMWFFFSSLMFVHWTSWVGKMFLECSQYFSRVRHYTLFTVAKFQTPTYNTFQDMNFFSRILVQYRQTESDAYEPTVHGHRWAQK